MLRLFTASALLSALAFACSKDPSAAGIGPVRFIDHPDAAALLQDELDLREGRFVPKLLAGAWQDLRIQDLCGRVISGDLYLGGPTPLVFLPEIDAGFALYTPVGWGEEYLAETSMRLFVGPDQGGNLSIWVEEEIELGPYNRSPLLLYDSSLAAMRKHSLAEFVQRAPSHRGLWIWAEMDLECGKLETLFRELAAKGIQRIGLSYYSVSEPPPEPDPDE